MSRPERSLVVVSAGLGTPSSTRLLADRLGAATEESLTLGGVDVRRETIELRDHAQDLVNHLLSGFPPPSLETVLRSVREADGLIAVSPIFSASYSGLFKLFFDVLERDELAGLPVLIGATGGTVRHSLALDHALRPLFAYLGASVVPTAVYAATEDWGGSDGQLVQRIGRAGGELAAAVAARTRPERPDGFADPVPFEDLLG